ncbi:MAG: transcriptional regulator [Chloroflexi bacterium]|nr:transcriptional regulator [Chloroflexota bacterium]
MRPERAFETDSWADYECRAVPPDVIACAIPGQLDGVYVYLLGLYLGDGYLTLAARHVWRLRIFQDKRYTSLVGQCREAIRSITQRDAGTVGKLGCVEIYSNWKHWLCLFPQHGAGPKHRRRIELRTWQLELVRRHPRELLRGLIQSDGCRSINRVRRPTRDGIKEYQYARYYFTNASPEIRGLFASACDLVDVDWRVMTERVISVARRSSVEALDAFIGPKS